jgi:hypothetical protein
MPATLAREKNRAQKKTGVIMDNTFELLTQDVNQFNLWREQHPDAPLDVDGRNLRGLDLSGAYLMGLCLDRLNLSHSTLCGAIFCGSSMKGANLHNTDLTDAVFGPPELVEAKFALSPLGVLCWLLNSSMRILRANIGIIKYHVAQSTIHLELFAI